MTTKYDWYVEECKSLLASIRYLISNQKKLQSFQNKVEFTNEEKKKVYLYILQNFDDIVDNIGDDIHKAWVVSKVESGWIYALSHNEKYKTHPLIKPTVELTEDEKKWDIDTAKMVMYSILFKIWNSIGD